MNEADEIEALLRADGQLAPGPASLTPLCGGVSCEIFKVIQGDRSFVVKRALAKLRVAAEWHADVSRNAVEHAFYQTMAGPLAGSIPRVFFHHPAHGYFTMECLGDDWQNWKERMMQGDIEPAHGTMAGALLGRLHSSTWEDAALREKFETTANFRQLRTDPYLRAAAARRPEVERELLAEADRLENCRVCLVHGDFSPKNLLVQDRRMMLLDAEVAWFGDPAFDVSFLLTHLFLKGLYHTPHRTAWQENTRAAWEAYKLALGPRMTPPLEARCVRLLPALLLARVDGKSPVEYLDPHRQETVRLFAVKKLCRPAPDLSGLISAWSDTL